MGTLSSNVISTTYKNLLFTKDSNDKVFYTNGSDADTEITTLASPLTFSGLITSTLGIKLDNSFIYDSNSNEGIKVTATGTAVNYLNVINSATGNAITIDVDGTDSNVGLTLDAKGSGVVTCTPKLIATAGLQLSNNVIYASDGGTAITLDTSDNVTITGDLNINGGDAIISGAEGGNASLVLKGDEGDDAGDEWQLLVNQSNQKLIIGNDIASAGTYVSLLEITPHATATSSTVTIAGDLAISGGNITSALTLDSSLAVTGLTTLSNNLTFSGARDITWTDSDGLEFKDAGASTYIAFSTDAIAVSQPTTYSAAAKATFNGGFVTAIKSFASDANGNLEQLDSGKYVLISNAMAGNRVVTLPAVSGSIGVHYIVKVTVDLSGTLNIISDAAGELIIGGVTHVDTNTDVTTQTMDTQVLAAAADEGIQLKADTKAGTWLDLVCDGSEWYLSGVVFADTAPSYVDA